MDEEEVGGRGGRRAPARAASGLGVGLKTALAAGAATLAILALAVLAPRGDASGLDEETFNDAGFLAVRTLASTDPEWWVGSGGVDLLAKSREVFADLFGEPGTRWWEDTARRIEELDLNQLEREEREEASRARERFMAAMEKWQKGGGADPRASANATRRLERTLERIDAKTELVVAGAWIREDGGATEGKVLAQHPASVSYDWSKRTTVGAGAYVDGMVGPTPARVFVAPMGKPKEGKPLVAYVALWKGNLATKAGGPSGLGLAMLLLGPLVVGGIAALVASAHAKHVKALAREIDRLGQAGASSRALRAQGAEASAVARSVERMVANLEFRSQHGNADLDEVVQRERRVAEEIHAALIGKNPPRLSDYEVETLFKPGFEIGGDHFEYFRIDEVHVGVILLDTNVRGIPAALVMASVRSYVRAVAPGVLSPAEVLRQVNRNLAGDLPPGRHVTAVYVVIDTKEGKATVASAGHLPLLVYRHASGKVAKVNPEGIALGLDVGPVFDRALQEGDIPIGVGDRIVLYTDGALQVTNADGEEFGEQNFYGAVAREAPKNSQAFVNFVGSTIDRFHLDAPQSDDITISTVKRLK
jgi:serine phosphatase RsbU (regulator of sigma subunit)